MGSALAFFLIILKLALLLPSCRSAQDYTNLVYKGCAKQPISDPNGAYSQALSSLYGTLIAQSSKAKFYKATQSSITGIFQCRGDLANVDCYNCVRNLPILMEKLCGRVVASRIQLYGCYMLYEVDGFAQISGMEMLYKTCSGTNAGGEGFEERRDTGLNSLENGMSSSSALNGFFATSFQGVYAMGQCEGDVGNSDCVACVKSAVQRAQVECGSSVSGQVYLHRCWIGYSYYPNGVPKKSSSDSYSSPSSSGSPNTGKTVAIILGGAAGVGFLVICLLFARGLIKRKDDY